MTTNINNNININNSEFKPKERKAITQSSVEILREKFAKWMKKYPDLARERLTQRTSLSQFHETINRKFMKMTEPEVRELFKVLDIDKCGFIDGDVAQVSPLTPYTHISIHSYTLLLLHLFILYHTQPSSFSSPFPFFTPELTSKFFTLTTTH